MTLESVFSRAITKLFSAGADLKEMDLNDRDEGWLGFSRMNVSKPTIAAVEGDCIAGGLEMALWCDLRVAGESATFGCFERRFGSHWLTVVRNGFLVSSDRDVPSI